MVQNTGHLSESRTCECFWRNEYLASPLHHVCFHRKWSHSTDINVYCFELVSEPFCNVVNEDLGRCISLKQWSRSVRCHRTCVNNSTVNRLVFLMSLSKRLDDLLGKQHYRVAVDCDHVVDILLRHLSQGANG